MSACELAGLEGADEYHLLCALADVDETAGAGSAARVHRRKSVYMIILALITLVSVYYAVETRQKEKSQAATPQPGELLQSAH